MSNKIFPAVLALACVFGQVAPCVAETMPEPAVETTAYVVYGSMRIAVPGGDGAFAARVVSVGSPDGRGPEAGVPGNALGPPDCRTRFDPGSYSLGCSGELVLAFDDAPVTDGPGPDIVLIEVGEARESAELSISADGVSWRLVGATGGGVEYIDVNGRAEIGMEYRYLRIRDLSDKCYGTMAGADIDAVAAIKHPPPPPPPPPSPPPPTLSGEPTAEPPPQPVEQKVERITLSGEVLFDSGKSELKPEARAALSGLLEKVKDGGYDVTVEGHGDSVGGDQINEAISLARAKTVADFLSSEGHLPAESVHAVGFGKKKPKADNSTTEGRTQNRRVEIVLKPLNN